MLSPCKATTLAAVLVVSVSITFAAPPEKEYKPDLPTIDISQELHRHTVIAAGTEQVYQGHPNSVLMPDGKTMFAVWCVNHGGPCGPMAQSSDAGKTWARLDDQLPAEFKKHRNCPAIYRMVDAAGKERLWVISGNKSNKFHMPRLLSEDGGKTWKEYEPIGLYGGMPMCSVVKGKTPGTYLGYYQNRIDAEGKELPGGPTSTSTFRIMQTVTTDGGQTWCEPTEVFNALNDPSRTANRFMSTRGRRRKGRCIY